MGAGATCDASLGGGYACFAGPGNDIALCAACDNSGTTFCGPGLTCLPTGTGSAGVCVQYCCTDADCGGVAGSCNLTLTETGLGGGLCVTGVPAGDAGAHDAGTHDAAAKDAAAHDAESSDAAAAPKPVCMGIPATPPSGGSCIMFSPDAGTSADGGWAAHGDCRQAVAKAAGRTAAYEWQYSLDQKTWNTLPITVKAKTGVSGLMVATTYYFRVQLITSAGVDDWSQVVSALVN
jgi:hypothetical protein